MAGVVCEYPSKAHPDGLAKWRLVFKDGRYFLLFIRGLAWPRERVTSRQEVDLRQARAHYMYARKIQGAKVMKFPPWSRSHFSETGTR